MYILQRLIGFVFPERCIGCGKRDETLCFACIATIPRADPFPKEWVRPLYYYKDPKIRKSLWALKYHNKKGLGKIFGALLYENFLEDASEMKIFKNVTEWIVIPIPSSPARMKKRGYNQAAVLAEGLCSADSGKFFISKIHALKKSRDTKSQTETKNRTERLGNIRDSFEVTDKSIVYSKHILLIDDIATTGATLIEARRVLKDAGAKNVIALTVAH